MLYISLHFEKFIFDRLPVSCYSMESGQIEWDTQRKEHAQSPLEKWAYSLSAGFEFN